eukprot:5794260-Pyramimonas_sp.AAC.1
MASRRQICVSDSTLEAEVLAADLALRNELPPALPLRDIVLQREAKFTLMEDNQVVCKVVKAGGSMKLMHLPRTHRIDVAAIPEQFTRGVVRLQCARAERSR